VEGYPNATDKQVRRTATVLTCLFDAGLCPSTVSPSTLQSLLVPLSHS